MPDDQKTQIDQTLNASDNLDEIYQFLYQQFTQMILGTEIPMPHFYVGTHKSGDLKLSSATLMALMGGDNLRMFYTPYPTLFITPETMRAIIEDLAFGKRFHSSKTDYSGQFTPELAQAEYERILKLSQSPDSVLGFSRSVD